MGGLGGFRVQGVWGSGCFRPRFRVWDLGGLGGLRVQGASGPDLGFRVCQAGTPVLGQKGFWWVRRAYGLRRVRVKRVSGVGGFWFGVWGVKRV